MLKGRFFLPSLRNQQKGLSSMQMGPSSSAGVSQGEIPQGQIEILKENANIIDKNVDSIFDPFTNQFLQNFDKLFTGDISVSANIKMSVVNDLKKRLKPMIYYALDKELEKYRVKHNINPKGLTAVQAQEYFLAFIVEYQEQHKTLAAAFIANYPQLDHLASNTTTAYTASLRTLSSRLAKDDIILKRLFQTTSPNKDPVAKIQLTNISSSGSDPHHGGEQVLILTFKVDGQDNRVVYKPRSVEIDAKITGNTEQLHDVLPTNSADISFFEMLNQAKDGKRLEHDLPTYLIVPLCDDDKNNIDGAYGYMQYLPHDPWNDLDVDLEAKTFFQQMAPSQRDAKLDQFQERIDNIVKEKIEEGSSDIAKCDYVTNKPKDVERYSYLCGAYIAPMLALGITDMHVENVITSRLSPYLVDLEASLNPAVKTIEGTGAFQAESGAFLETTKSPAPWSCIVDITGDFGFNKHGKVDRNRPYIYGKGCLWFSSESLNPCSHDRPKIEQGLIDSTDLICNNRQKVLDFIQHLGDIPVRVVPIPTSDLNYLQMLCIQSHFASGADTHEFEDTISKLRLGALKDHADGTIEDPVFVAYSHSYFAKEFGEMSIPIFYMRANDRVLLDCNGQNIVQPLTPDHYATHNIMSTDIKNRISDVFAKLIDKDKILYFPNSTPMEAASKQTKNMVNGEQALAQFNDSTASKIVGQNTAKDLSCCGQCRIT